MVKTWASHKSNSTFPTACCFYLNIDKSTDITSRRLGSELTGTSFNPCWLTSPCCINQLPLVVVGLMCCHIQVDVNHPPLVQIQSDLNIMYGYNWHKKRYTYCKQLVNISLTKQGVCCALELVLLLLQGPSPEELAAQMNAEFDDLDSYELSVEAN